MGHYRSGLTKRERPLGIILASHVVAGPIQELGDWLTGSALSDGSLAAARRRVD